MDISMQSKEIGEKLRAPFPSKLVSWRVGKTNSDGSRGQALPYISPRAVQDRLDEVVGPACWSNSFESVALGQSSSIIATIKLLLDGSWIAKSDASQLDSFQEEANREIAVKGVYSDSFKRAAVLWGIGRYLYAYEAPWVALDNGRLAEIPKLPAHMLPEDERTAQADVKVEKQVVATPAPQAAPVVAEQVAAVATPAVVEVKAEEVKAEEVKETPAVVAAAESTPAPEAVAPAKEETPEPVKEAAAPQAEPAAPAPTPAPAAVKQTVSDEERARNLAASLVDQELGNDSAAGTSSGNATGEEALRNSLKPDQLKTFDGLLEKIKKNLPAQMLRNYVRSPKAEAALPVEARTHILALLDKADADKAAA